MGQHNTQMVLMVIEVPKYCTEPLTSPVLLPLRDLLQNPSLLNNDILHPPLRGAIPSLQVYCRLSRFQCLDRCC